MGRLHSFCPNYLALAYRFHAWYQFLRSCDDSGISFSGQRSNRKHDLKNLSWDVLWLISGGIAPGLGLESTGLSQTLVTNIPCAELSPLMIAVMATELGPLMSTFISNTATANLLLPIMATLWATVSTLCEIGGSKLLVLLVTFSCSL